MWRFNLQAADDVPVLHTNSAAAASIPSWFDFIRNEESRNAGEKPVHGFLGSLSNRDWFRDSSRRLLLKSRTVLRVDGSGMKSHYASAPVPPEPLKLLWAAVTCHRFQSADMSAHSKDEPAPAWS
jgi:hypothetical protein